MTSNMFHQGDLQSGIASAIRQQKLVACFIYKPDDQTSKTWEDVYLRANTCSGNVCGQIGSLVGEKAVLLKIELGSTEAGFLSAFCPVEAAPSLVVIRNGKVLETIESGVEEEAFVERLGKAVGLHDEDDGEKGEEDVTEPSTAVEREVLESDPLMPRETQQADAGSTTAEQASSFPTQTTSDTPNQANTLLAERARRLENERLRRKAREKAARLARQKARQEEEAASSTQTTTTERNEQQQARDAWIYQQKQRKDEAKKEKVRILQQIEADKQERKAAALRRKQGAGEGEFSELLAESGSRAVATGIKSGSCALQIRLFDGSSIKGKFAADADLATAVRTWVKEASPEGGADVPFEFRQILAPQPSRSIGVGEEGETLQNLGLVPSATLVLVPVSGAVNAYSGNSGYISWLGSTAYAFGSSLLSAIPFLGGNDSSPSPSSATGGGPYMAGTGDPQDLSNARGAEMADADGGQTAMGAKVRMKTLADQRAEEGRKGKESTEFYNGNSSAFQGDGDGK